VRRTGIKKKRAMQTSARQKTEMERNKPRRSELSYRTFIKNEKLRIGAIEKI